MNSLVFVYGSLLSGLGNHRCLDGALFQEAKELTGFRMVSLGGFPGLIYGEGTITGELYLCDEVVMVRLDRLESNGRFYTRKIHQDAWVYVLPYQGYKHHQPVPSGDWKQHIGYQPRGTT